LSSRNIILEAIQLVKDSDLSKVRAGITEKDNSTGDLEKRENYQ
jgi:hypothetical protein